MDYDASDSTSSASESSSDLPALPLPSVSVSDKRPFKSSDAPVSKKRKTTYYVRKDEIAELQDQVKLLHEKLQQYERRAPPSPSPPTSTRPDTSTLSDALTTNGWLALLAEQNHLAVAGTQATMTAYNLDMIRSSGVVPLSSFIHLPVDREQRNDVLSAQYAPRLTAAARFMAERTRNLDLRVAHRQIEEFRLPGGDAAALTLHVNQFDNGHSLRQVHAALMQFLIHQETSIFEHVGVLTVRESEKLEELAFGQTRLLSSLPCGLEVECNVVSFNACVDATEDAPGFAVGVMDFVDQDDLYPYRPDVCLRKELTGAVTLHEVPSLTGGKPTIAMTRWSYVRIPPSTFSLSDETDLTVSNDMLQWCDIIPKAMKATLKDQTPAP